LRTPGPRARYYSRCARSSWQAVSAASWTVDCHRPLHRPDQAATDRQPRSARRAGPRSRHAGLPRARGASRIVGTSARLDLPDKIAGRPRFVGPGLPGNCMDAWWPPSPAATLTSGYHARRRDAAGRRCVLDGRYQRPRRGREPRSGGRCAAGATVGERDTRCRTGRLPDFLRGGPVDCTSSAGRTPSALSRGRCAPPAAAFWRTPRSRRAAVTRMGRTTTVWSHSRALRAAPGDRPGAESRRGAGHRVPRGGADCYGHNGADDAAFGAVLLADPQPAGAGALVAPGRLTGPRSGRRWRST
jgi:hypothetical protein